ncbi:hypothetical protein [Helicobacter japonicus]|uniref:hypothetical protein n=1 Tax=Helicobacter japonicus TaxID=425400 RepID=UPI0023EF684F|nr:hypothetical protein [Helicobacter japonicus]
MLEVSSRLTPGTSLSASPKSLKGFCSNSSLVTILTEAGASTTFFSLPEAAVTTEACNFTLRVTFWL